MKNVAMLSCSCPVSLFHALCYERALSHIVLLGIPSRESVIQFEKKFAPVFILHRHDGWKIHREYS